MYQLIAYMPILGSYRMPIFFNSLEDAKRFLCDEQGLFYALHDDGTHEFYRSEAFTIGVLEFQLGEINNAMNRGIYDNGRC